MAPAPALARAGVGGTVLGEAPPIGGNGAGLPLGPQAVSAFDALGVGELARSRAVYTERLVLMDAVDETEVASIPVGEAFRKRFRNPYAVSHRADLHQSLHEAVLAHDDIEVRTQTHVHCV